MSDPATPLRRVLVIGPGGAGKSTFAARLAQRTGLPLIHLDQHYWRAGWVEPSNDEWLAKVDELVASERWIMDGNFGGTMERRLAALRADQRAVVLRSEREIMALLESA